MINEDSSKTITDHDEILRIWAREIKRRSANRTTFFEWLVEATNGRTFTADMMRIAMRKRFMTKFSCIFIFSILTKHSLVKISTMRTEYSKKVASAQLYLTPCEEIQQKELVYLRLLFTTKETFSRAISVRDMIRYEEAEEKVKKYKIQAFFD